VASWTLHAIAVKVAFQLGLHSPISYKNHAFQDSELRKRIWYAVLNQDKYVLKAFTEYDSATESLQISMRFVGPTLPYPTTTYPSGKAARSVLNFEYNSRSYT
jgi:hypothetical protein